MRKRGLGFLLCLVMLVGLLPTTVFAVESATVKTYNELWSAIYSKNDYYITLDSDITYTVPEGGNTPLSPWQYLLNVDGTKNKTIDLNGHTLQVLNEQTSWPTQGGLFNIEDTASLTVMNGTIKLYNYNNSKRTDMGVFNARGGNLTLTNVDVLNCRDGTAVNAQGSATVNIEGGTISAFSGFAVTAVGTSWLTLNKNVVLTTITGSGLITQPADNGYGSLHASTSNLTVVSAMFEAGIEVAESTISQFSASANRLVFVGGTQYNSAFATSKSGDYYWDTNATGGCALVVNDKNYSFAKNVNVISTAAKQPVVVTNGTASPNQAAYGATVTITADNIQGKVFSGWTVESGGVTLADSSAKTTTFTMGAKAAAVKAHYTNVPISSAEFTVATPVQGGHPSAATTTTEHITVSETWCVEKYDENSFSSTLPDSHTFEGGHTYRVGVAFEVEQGYALDNSFSVKFVDPISGTETPASQGATQYIWLADYTVENNSVENPFTDIKNSDYYFAPVLWAVESKITSGTSATTFSPGASCTRAQMVTFLWRAAGSPEPTSTTCPFIDVKMNSYYGKAVLWAVENGITSGTSATTFGPDVTCTRAQAVTFLYRAAGEPETSGKAVFEDVKENAYYAKAVSWAAENNITSGTSATKFSPDNECTRSQIVTFLYRYANI